MTRISFMISLCTLSFLALGQPVVAAAEPSVRDVYALAESGRVQEAQQLMQQILRDHPNSGKAHFVNAELLAKEGRLAAARAELATAERLAPGLSFATRESVRNLQARLSLSGGGVRSESPTQSVPWGMLLFGALAIFGIIWIVRSMLRRAATPATMTSNAAPPVNGPMYGYGASPPPAAGGLGSGIMGGLVTGAAIGAGMVAGEALAHRLTDDPTPHDRNNPVPNQPGAGDIDDNLGGQDFGVNDNSSWDSGGGDSGGGGWD